MPFGRITVSIALASALLAGTAAAQQPFDQKKYPDIAGQWQRVGPLGVFDSTKPPARGQQAPLTPEYQKIFEANLADVAQGGSGDDPVHTCIPEGMPRAMNLVLPMEVIITPNTTYILMEYLSMLRRIYTDGRSFPEGFEPSYMGYSVGKWFDTDNDGTYDTLEIETRNMRGPRLFDSVGTPLSKDNDSVVKEKIYLDKSNPDVLWNEITTEDGALTRPWTVKRFYKRESHPIYKEYNCTEDNRWVAIGGELYLADSEGYLMPIQKGQSAPDLKYLQKYFPQAKK